MNTLASILWGTSLILTLALCIAEPLVPLALVFQYFVIYKIATWGKK